MNFSIVRYILGCVMCFESAFLMFPCIVAAINTEKQGFAFLIVAALTMVLGVLLIIKKPKNTVFYAKEGFVTVALCWIVMSIIGAVPFVLSGDIPNYVDALFETISGFTTTGASILPDVESLSKCSLFWRSFTHWVGGMGVLVFMLAILPLAGGYSMHLMKAESPGPNVGKLVPRVRKTAFILYVIYIVMTLIELILLLCGGMSLFEGLTTSFGTAGTGGFAINSDSLGGYSNYIQTVVIVFMVLFGVNFSLYYMLLIKKIKDVLRSEELKWYLGIFFASTALIAINILDKFDGVYESIHHSAFQVASIMSTTGFATTDFGLWPEFSKAILVLLMFIGASAGSTGGGMKISRLVILFKIIKNELQHFIHPRSVKAVKMDGKSVEKEVQHTVGVFFMILIILFSVSVIILCFDKYSLTTNFTAVAATINNVGPGLEIVGPTGHFGGFNILSKIVLMFDMLAGRLELIPMLIIFMPSVWKKS